MSLKLQFVIDPVARAALSAEVMATFKAAFGMGQVSVGGAELVVVARGAEMPPEQLIINPADRVPGLAVFAYAL